MNNKLHKFNCIAALRRSKLMLTAVLTMGAVLGLASAPAFAATGYVCLQANNALCLDNPANGDGVQVDNGYQWTQHVVGTVGNQVNFSGSAAHFNTKFAGDTVVQLQNSSGSNCIRVNSASPETLTTGGCGAGAYLIEHGGYLVHYQDTQNTNGEFIVETSAAYKGSPVIVDLPITGGFTDWTI